MSRYRMTKDDMKRYIDINFNQLLSILYNHKDKIDDDQLEKLILQIYGIKEDIKDKIEKNLMNSDDVKNYVDKNLNPLILHINHDFIDRLIRFIKRTK